MFGLAEVARRPAVVWQVWSSHTVPCSDWPLTIRLHACLKAELLALPFHLALSIDELAIPRMKTIADWCWSFRGAIGLRWLHGARVRGGATLNYRLSDVNWQAGIVWFRTGFAL